MVDTAGTLVIDLGAREPLPAGIYLVRVVHGDAAVVAKGIVVR